MQSVLNPAEGHPEARADRLFAAGKLGQAFDLYLKVLQQDPGRLDIRARLGELALLRHQPKQAITYLAAALNNGLRTRALWQTLADAYLANAEPGSAALCYERAGRQGLAGTLAVMADRELYRIQNSAESHRFEWLPDTPLPVVQGEVNGFRLNLLVDTAAGDLVLDGQFAVAAGIPHGGSESRYFAGGLPAMVTYGHVERLQLGALIVHDLLTQILDLHGRLGAYSPRVPIHGIIGVSLLSRFNVVLDFRRRTLGLDAPVPSAEHQAGDVGAPQIPFWIAAGQFLLVAAETPPEDARLWVIDTGMAGAAFAVFADAAETRAAAKRDGAQAAGVGGGGTIEAKHVTLPRLCLGCIERRDVEGMALESTWMQDQFGFHTAGLLACDFFQDALLAFDFNRMTLTLG